MAKARKLPPGSKVTVAGTEFTYLEEITLPDRSVGVTDVTVMADTADVGYTQYPPNYGTIKVKGFYDPDSSEDLAIEALLDTDNPSDTTIVVSIRKTKSGTWSYNTRTYVGRMTMFKIDPIRRTEGIKCEFEMKVNAIPTNGTA